MTVQRQFASAVTEMSQDTCVGAFSEHGTTIMQFDLRQLDLPCASGTPAPLCWRQAPYHGAMHALSTFHNPLKYRFIVAQGSYRNDQHQRVDFTPAIQGVSTAQQMRHSMLRLACSLAVACGVSLRPMALIFSSLFLTSHYPVVAQEMDGCHWFASARARGAAAAPAGSPPGDGGSS